MEGPVALLWRGEQEPNKTVQMKSIKYLLTFVLTVSKILYLTTKLDKLNIYDEYRLQRYSTIWTKQMRWRNAAPQTVFKIIEFHLQTHTCKLTQFTCTYPYAISLVFVQWFYVHCECTCTARAGVLGNSLCALRLSA